MFLNRRQRRLIIAGLFLAVLPAGLLLAGPAIIRAIVVRAVAENLHGDCRVDSVAIDWTRGRLEISNLTCSGVVPGYHVAIAARALAADLSLRSLAKFRLRLDEAAFGEGRAELTRLATLPWSDTLTLPFSLLPADIDRISLGRWELSFTDSLGQLPPLPPIILESMTAGPFVAGRGASLPSGTACLSFAGGVLDLTAAQDQSRLRLTAAGRALRVAELVPPGTPLTTASIIGFKAGMALEVISDAAGNPVLVLAPMLEAAEFTNTGGSRVSLPEGSSIRVGGIGGFGAVLTNETVAIRDLTLTDVEVTMTRTRVTIRELNVARADAAWQFESRPVTASAMALKGVRAVLPDADVLLDALLIDSAVLRLPQQTFRAGIRADHIRIARPLPVRMAALTATIAEADLRRMAITLSGRLRGIELDPGIRIAGMDVQGAKLSGRIIEVRRVLVRGPEVTVVKRGDSWIVLALPRGQTAPAATARQFRVARLEISTGRATFRDESRNTVQTVQFEAEADRIVTPTGLPATLQARITIPEVGVITTAGTLQLIALDPSFALGVEVDCRELALRGLEKPLRPYVPVDITGGQVGAHVRVGLNADGLDALAAISVRGLKLAEPADGTPVYRVMGFPLPFAAGLVLGAGGDIDLEVPVLGSLDELKVDWSRVVTRAFGGAVRNTALGPFKDLGSMPEDALVPVLDPVTFAMLEKSLDDTGLAHVARLAAAFRERPQLRLQLSAALHEEEGAWFDAADRRKAVLDQRAGTVRAALVAGGLDAARIVIISPSPASRPCVYLTIVAPAAGPRQNFPAAAHDPPAAVSAAAMAQHPTRP